MTVAVGRVRSAIRSSVRLARISWTMPTMTLVEMTASDTRASVGRPTSTSARPSTNRMLLTNVKTFSRTICAYVRVVGGGGGVAETRRAAAQHLRLVQAGRGRGRQVRVTGDAADRGIVDRGSAARESRFEDTTLTVRDDGHAGVPGGRVPWVHRDQRSRSGYPGTGAARSSRAATARPASRRPGTAGPAGTARGRVTARRGSRARPSGAAAGGCRRSAAPAPPAPAP